MDLAQTFEALTAETIAGYVENQQEENLHLEFKLVSGLEFRSSDDKRNLARALSGFANASGGLIVWGVEAKKNAENIDCAIAAKQMNSVGTLVSSLNRLTGEAIDPIADGIRHRALLIGDSNAGFAVTVVPESDGGPHMAKLGENRYYKRSGDSFYQMEHYDIADMFGRRRRPKLELTTLIRGGGQEIVVGLKNTGRASAGAPYLFILAPPPFRRTVYGLDGNRSEGLPLLASSSNNTYGALRYGASGVFTIHPGMSHDIGCLSRERINTPLPAEGVALEYAIACEGMRLQEGKLVIPLADFK